MKNDHGITIEDLASHYQPLVWDTCDHITNLSDETVGYYAYKLQEIIFANNPSVITELLKDNSILISERLEQMVCPMDELSITYKTKDFMSNYSQQALDYYNKPETKAKIIADIGQEGFDKIIARQEDQVKNPVITHLFDLLFWVMAGGAGRAVILRNGYLLKCIQEAGIKTFEELDDYEAVLIFNHAEVNSHICSFVKFQKKN